MPTDLPPDYKPAPKPTPGEGKPSPDAPEPGVDAPDPAGEPATGGDVVDPVGWKGPAPLPGIEPDEQPAPAGAPTF